MSDLVRRRLGVDATVEAPTAAGDEYFRDDLPSPEERELDFCYQGSGAVWQDLPRLNAVWREIVALRPDARFMVLSYDPRCRALADGMPAGSVELVEAFDAADVARHLSRCRVGFVLRRRDLVNQVSYPTKIGESLGCGVALVLTDIDWDPADLLAGSPVARLVDADSSAAATARAAVELLDALTPGSPSACRGLAGGLRRDRLVADVRAALHREPIDVDA
jgi:glycosyltransferase involved in cell wall biosynthesis